MHRLNKISTKDKSMEMVNEYIREYKDVFSATEFDQLPERRPWDHVIELTPGFKPVDCKVYPLSPKEQVALKEFIDENLKSGRIRESKSPMASPFSSLRNRTTVCAPSRTIENSMMEQLKTSIRYH